MFDDEPGQVRGLDARAMRLRMTMMYFNFQFMLLLLPTLFMIFFFLMSPCLRT